MNSRALQQAMVQADRLKAAGDLQAAENYYRRIIDTDANYHPAYHSLGLLALQVNKLPLAADLVARAAELGPKTRAYFSNLCEIRRRLGRLDEAIAAGRKAVKLDPMNAGTHYNLALALTDKRLYSDATSEYRAAIRIDPGYGLAWNNLGSCLERMGQKEEAEEAYAKAVQINPQHSEAQNNLGALYCEKGQLEKACEAFSAAITAQPGFVEAHYNLSSLKTYSETDPHLDYLESIVNQAGKLSVEANIRYHFALGKARDDIGKHAEAFEAYKKANQLQFGLMQTREDYEVDLLQQLISRLDEDFFSTRTQPETTENHSRTPIFIVGMPRSGTTLIEQVLSSHPDVYGAGELGNLNQIIITAKNRTHKDTPFIDWVNNLSITELHELGQTYLDQVWELQPDTKYITDKMPANFFYCGLINMMFPNAKIIHSRRDPMDSCFSCYSRLFNETMHFAYDLETLGRYYNRYMSLMNHWETVLPEGTILDVHYEENVADLETQTTRMLDYIGLPWDDKCLEFYNNERRVKTASVAQVRKPIYSTSVEKWRRYGDSLRPLLQIVHPEMNSDYQEED